MRAIWNLFIGMVCVTFCSIAALAGDWDNTKHAIVLDGKLYTIEMTGAMYVTDLSNGTWKQLGKPDFGKTKLLVAGTSNLFTIEDDGNLFRVSPADGTWSRVGRSGDWKNTMVGAAIGDKLYTVETEGALFETDLTNGSWRKIVDREFIRTWYFFSDGGRLYSIEQDGYYHSVNPATGAKKRISNSNDWLNTKRATMYNGKLFSTEGGALYVTDPTNGTWKQIGKKEFGETDFLFGAGGSLYSIALNGNLYKISPADGTWVQIGK